MADVSLHLPWASTPRASLTPATVTSAQEEASVLWTGNWIESRAVGKDGQVAAWCTFPPAPSPVPRLWLSNKESKTHLQLNWAFMSMRCEKLHVR